MASEDRCRLTYAEGRRISTEAQKPYLKKAAVLSAAALGVVIVGGFVSNFLAGLPIFGNGSGVRLLGQMILEGDAGAVETLYDFTERMNFIAFAGGGLMAFGLAFFVLADVAGREALKKANDEKVQEEVYRRDPQRTTGRQSAASPHGQEYGEDWPSRTVHWQKRPHTRHVKTSAADPEDGES